MTIFNFDTLKPGFHYGGKHKRKRKLGLMLAFALQEVKTKYRSGIIRAPGYLPHVVSYTWPVETLDPDCPAQKTAEGSDDFVYVCPCVEFRFHLGQTYSACVYVGPCPSACPCACIASENQALVHYL